MLHISTESALWLKMQFNPQAFQDAGKSGAAPPASPLEGRPAAMVKERQRPENPWMTINDMLIQNRCWLCEGVFARGKMKKVFMLSHLLRYLEERYKLEEAKALDPSTPTCRQLTTEVVAAVAQQQQEKQGEEDKDKKEADDGGIMLDMLKDLSAKGLQWCYEEFKALNGDQDKISARLIEAECETWMSGLICARSPECAMEYLLIVPDGKVSTTIMAGESGFKGGSSDQNCDVNCGCDNPWHYIAASLMESAS